MSDATHAATSARVREETFDLLKAFRGNIIGKSPRRMKAESLSRRRRNTERRALVVGRRRKRVCKKKRGHFARASLTPSSALLPSLQKVLAHEHHGGVELEVLVLLLGEAVPLVLRHHVPDGRAVLAHRPRHLLGLVP